MYFPSVLLLALNTPFGNVKAIYTYVIAADGVDSEREGARSRE